MTRLLTLAICALTAPGLALAAASRTYDTAAFDAVSVAAGVQAEITIGPRRSVLARTPADDFDDLRVTVKGNVLHLDRPLRSWFFFRRHPDYQVQIVMPALRSVAASSGARVTLSNGGSSNLSVTVSSGGMVNASVDKGAAVQAHASSGSRLQIAGSCTSLEAGASTGADLDAQDLDCQDVIVRASSGSNVTVTASRRITVKGSSGSSTRVSGKPASVQIDKSSGARITIR